MWSDKQMYHALFPWGLIGRGYADLRLLQYEIPDIEFYKPKRVNESEKVSIKKSRWYAAIQLTEDGNSMDCSEEMKTLYDAAACLRK